MAGSPIFITWHIMRLFFNSSDSVSISASQMNQESGISRNQLAPSPLLHTMKEDIFPVLCFLFFNQSLIHRKNSYQDNA